jgi:hypothetical protein
VSIAGVPTPPIDTSLARVNPAYVSLQIAVGGGTAVTMPFSQELEITTCLSSEAKMGPEPSVPAW